MFSKTQRSRRLKRVKLASSELHAQHGGGIRLLTGKSFYLSFCYRVKQYNNDFK